MTNEPPIEPQMKPRKGRKPKSPATPRKPRQPAEYRIITRDGDGSTSCTIIAPFGSPKEALDEIKANAKEFSGKDIYIVRCLAGPFRVWVVNVERVNIAPITFE